MNIANTQYTLSTSSLEIFVSGCREPHCEGCCNPQLWDFNIGNPWEQELIKIKNKINDFDSMIDNIILVGGDPMDQNHISLINMLIKLKTFNKDIYLFTKYSINEVPLYIKNLCDYIKCGRYKPELKVDNNIQYGIKLATSNQRIYKVKEEY